MTHRETSANPSHPEDTHLQRFGATLRAYRQQRRLSQRALAARTGIHHTYISEIELGQRNITVLTLLRLAQALRLPSASLLAPLDTRAPVAPAGGGPPLSSGEAHGAGAPSEDRPAMTRDDQAALLHLLGATIRHYRQQGGLSQQALASNASLDNWYLSQSEQGQRNLSMLSLVRLADALGLAVSHLLAPLDTYQHPAPPPT